MLPRGEARTRSASSRGYFAKRAQGKIRPRGHPVAQVGTSLAELSERDANFPLHKKKRLNSVEREIDAASGLGRAASYAHNVHHR